MKRIDISNFEMDDSFYQKLDLLLTVKSFDLQAIRKRYIASRKNKSGKAGSVQRRKVSTGGIVALQIQEGEQIYSEVLTRTKEPRGIDQRGVNLAIATEDIVFIHDEDDSYVLKHPWFSYIHTVRFSPHHEDRILIVASGLDMLLEMNYKTKEVSFEWLAWENGWNKAHDPDTNEEILLTRLKSQAKEWEQEGLRYKLIQDPKGQVLPTAMRAAFINSVAYDKSDENILYATFFHEGAVFKINRTSGETSKVLGDLKNPHGGVPLNGNIFATSTSSGEVVLKNNNRSETTRFDFSNLKGKPSELGQLEWLQNSISIGKNSFLTIDSNRNQFIIFDIEKEKYSVVDYDDDWAVQDIVIHQPTTQEKEWLKQLGDSSFHKKQSL